VVLWMLDNCTGHASRVPFVANDDVVPKKHEDTTPPSSDHMSYHLFWVHKRSLKTGIKIFNDGSRVEIVMFAPSIKMLSTQPTAAYLATMEVMFFQHVIDIIHSNPLTLQEVCKLLLVTFVHCV